MLRVCLAAFLSLLTCSDCCCGGIIINLNFTGGLSTSQQNVFTGAKNFWETALTGYRPGVSITGVTINASGQAIDGVGGVLGSAGPSTIVSQGGYVLATSGSMQFDTADLNRLESNGALQNVILHEMAHVLGFGTLWTYNGVYVNNTGQYTGASALAQWKTEFGQTQATFIPVELGGGAGTANGHWNEVDGGANLTGIRNSQNRDMRDELMTGWLNPNSFVSNMTIASFSDIGFTVAAVPEPSSFLLMAIAIAGVPVVRRLSERRQGAKQESDARE